MSGRHQTDLHWSQGYLQGSSALLVCCCCSCYLNLGFFLGCPQIAASFPPGIFQEEVSKAVRGWPISAGSTPIRGKGCCRYGPTANPAKPVPLLPNDFLKVFLAACKLQEKLFCSRGHCGLCSSFWEWGGAGSAWLRWLAQPCPLTVVCDLPRNPCLRGLNAFLGQC